MIDILHRFLLQNRSISIPGLGTLHAERIPARMSNDALQLIPPGYSFRFDKYFDAPDKAFFVYLSGRQGVPEYESMRLYNQFAQDFRSAIMMEEKAEWPGIGFFRKNVSGEVEFVQTRSGDTGYSPVALVAAKPIINLAPDAQQENLNDISAGSQIAGDDQRLDEEYRFKISPEPEAEAGAAIHAPVSGTEFPVGEKPNEHEIFTTEESTLPEVESRTAVQPSLTTIDSEIADEVATEPAGIDYLSISEDDTDRTSHTRKTILRIGWSIAAAASLLMILHFSQHGLNLKAVANNQSFQPARP